MTTSHRLLFPLAFVCLLFAAPLSAQTEESTRPAFTTSDGDTGLWYVPTAEVLAKGKWSTSGYRVSLNYVPGFANVADFPLTFGVGVSSRLELFGSFKAVTRIDRDLRPLFISNPDVGGPIARYPFANTTWTGSKRGDFLVGAKINVLSEARHQPVALSIRGSLKLPTGDKDGGVSTGKIDTFLDAVVSKEVPRIFELSGYAGGAFRSSPDSVTQSNGLRWGFGGAFPSRGPVRMTAELNGEKPFDGTITLASPFKAVDNSTASGSYNLQNFAAGTIGLTVQLPNGFFAGLGMTKSFPARSRSGFLSDSDPSADFVDYQFRIGFHPGTRLKANRPPTVTATCGPCTVMAGQPITLTATAQDPDGDALTYRWSAATGTLASPDGSTTALTSPSNFEGTIPATVTVDDGKGGTATATVNVIVTRPPNQAPAFGAGPAGAGARGAPQSPITITGGNNAAGGAAPCPEPCVVLPGQTVTLTANATDPDGDSLTYRWSAPAGTFSNPTGRTTEFTAPNQDGSIPVTVTVTDDRGGTTTATTNVTVQRPAPIVELSFEDVYFDFDRSSIRPEAQRLLDDAIAKLQANPTKNLVIEGHTCNIGTAEYNLALGERRAKSVADYMTSRGIPLSRLETVSYGEEQPKYDNGREETRRLNRRAALTIKVQ